MTTKHNASRPHMGPDADVNHKREELKLDAAISVLEVLASVRQSAMMSPDRDSLNPKEEAAYNAALDRLEHYLDAP